MAQIPLRARDGSVRAWAIVDDADFDVLGRWRWCVCAGGYAGRTERAAGGQWTVLLHREILGLRPGDGQEVDHWDLDKLNCRRSNLRVVTHAQNGQNLRSRRGARSQYRGVSWNCRRGAWAARVKISGRAHFGGYFDDEEEAATKAHRMRAELMTHAGTV